MQIYLGKSHPLVQILDINLLTFGLKRFTTFTHHEETAGLCIDRYLFCLTLFLCMPFQLYLFFALVFHICMFLHTCTLTALKRKSSFLHTCITGQFQFGWNDTWFEGPGQAFALPGESKSSPAHTQSVSCCPLGPFLSSSSHTAPLV